MTPSAFQQRVLYSLAEAEMLRTARALYGGSLGKVPVRESTSESVACDARACWSPRAELSSSVGPGGLLLLGAVALTMSGSDSQVGCGPGGASSDLSDSDKGNSSHNTSRKRFGLARVMPKEGKKRVNYSKGDARRIMEEAVSLCEVMSLGYEVVFHGRRRSYAAPRSV